MSDLNPIYPPTGPAIFEAIPARSAELGPITIRRALPTRKRRMVGPWCFLDRFRPLTFQGEKLMDVAPHPHIGLQTVSWLLDGEIVHNDSLGCQALIRPGELNLMTAGRGIAHTEETPAENSGIVNGVQLWVALPDANRHSDPQFHHHALLPYLDLPGGHAALLMGEWSGSRSPALALSPMMGAQLSVHKREELSAPLNPAFEHALLVLDGDVSFEGQPLAEDVFYYLGLGRTDLNLTSKNGARVLLIGGEPFQEKILMWWNFVARTPEEIEAARTDWQQRQGFRDVAAYQGPRTEAPPLVLRPKAAE
jgi:redox-sensitive bicupin YhaK (pirin superfamily)